MACPMPRAPRGQHVLRLWHDGHGVACCLCHKTWALVKRSGANMGCKRPYDTMVPTYPDPEIA